MVRLSNAELKRYAAMGVQARIQELQTEIDQLRRFVPNGSNNGTGRRMGRPPKATADETNEPAAEPEKRRRRRKKMTPEQRAEVSARMKKFWADRRTAKGGKKKAGRKATANA